jgi:hypothetical protein
MAVANADSAATAKASDLRRIICGQSTFAWDQMQQSQCMLLRGMTNHDSTERNELDELMIATSRKE